MCSSVNHQMPDDPSQLPPSPEQLQQQPSFGSIGAQHVNTS